MAGVIAVAAPIRLTTDRILVARPPAGVEVTRSGIYIPEIATVPLDEGVIAAVGPGVLTKRGVRLPLELRIGDRVVFSKYAKTKLESRWLHGEFLIMREDDVLAVIDPGDDEDEDEEDEAAIGSIVLPVAALRVQQPFL